MDPCMSYTNIQSYEIENVKTSFWYFTEIDFFTSNQIFKVWHSFKLNFQGTRKNIMDTDNIERGFSLFIHPRDEWLYILPILHYVCIYITSKSVKIIKYCKIK